ncbi:MAG TPA: hypothetical protein VFZ93_03405 [Albitalea sp.]
MKSVQAIRRLGFRKWYERELLQSHLHLVLLLLATLGMVGAAEALTQRAEAGTQLVMLACAAVSAVIGVWALRRYLFLLNHAEFVADQAVCAQCESYGKWDVTGEEPEQARMGVCCRKCGNRWEIAL